MNNITFTITAPHEIKEFAQTLATLTEAEWAALERFSGKTPPINSAVVATKGPSELEYNKLTGKQLRLTSKETGCDRETVAKERISTFVPASDSPPLVKTLSLLNEEWSAPEDDGEDADVVQKPF